MKKITKKADYHSKPDLRRAILRILRNHRGYEKRVMRAELRGILNRKMDIHVSDRLMRRAIEDLRSEDPRGAWICSDTRPGAGYFMATSLDELNTYLTSDENRLRTIYHRIRLQRQRAGLSEQSGQPALFTI
jgi:hypothetical protein